MPRVHDNDLEDYALEDDERRLEHARAAREANGSSAASLPAAADGDIADVPWMHVEGDEAPEDTREVTDAASGEDEIDAFLEHFNAHDLDGLLELVGDDCESPGLVKADEDLAVALADLWERRPTCQMTRGDLEDEPVGVLWEVGTDTTWWRLGVVRFSCNVEGDIDVIAFDDAPHDLDACQAQPPEATLDEGATWQEWEDGVAPN